MNDDQNAPTLLGTTKPFLKALNYEKVIGYWDLEPIFEKYVRETGIGIVSGIHMAQMHLHLMHWPETRPDYVEQSLEDAERSAKDLAVLMNATKIEDIVPKEGTFHCMMGLRVNGYESGAIAEWEDLQPFAEQINCTNSWMVSARKLHDGTVEAYREPTVLLSGPIEKEHVVHELGDFLKQHHYAIETASETRFYETRWARSA